jgi:RNA-binding protein
MNQTNEIPAAAPMLTPAQRKELRARAHHLDPVVMIGDAGLSEPVLAEANRALIAHELIKIRVLGDDRELRQALMTELCAALSCAPVQMIGKLLVVYRPRPDSVVAPNSRPRKPSEPHRPKKALGARLESGSPAQTTPARKKTAARTAPASPRKSLSAKTAGKRTDLHSNEKPPARRGKPSAATRGPTSLQGKPGARTAGPRSRAKGRAGS